MWEKEGGKLESVREDRNKWESFGRGGGSLGMSWLSIRFFLVDFREIRGFGGGE